MWMDYLDMDNEYPEIEKQDFDLESNSFIDGNSLESECDGENGTIADFLFADDSVTNEICANTLSAKHEFDTMLERNQYSSDNNHKEIGHHHSNEISFMGYGRCECGCGSFVGSGNTCRACHHSFDAHSRYKK